MRLAVICFAVSNAFHNGRNLPLSGFSFQAPERSTPLPQAIYAERLGPLSPAEFVALHQELLADLASCARRQVIIDLDFHCSFYGMTHASLHSLVDGSGARRCVSSHEAVRLTMNPRFLQDVRLKYRARALWRGLALHELCHHFSSARAQYLLASELGVLDTFNLLDDEQIERRVGRLWRDWLPLFQGLNAYVFPAPGSNRYGRMLSAAAGTSQLDSGSSCRLRFAAFAFHLRRRRPLVLEPKTDAEPALTADPAVAAALALVPENLASLSKSRLLELCLPIHELISS